MVARTPVPGATDVPLASTVSVTFDEPVHPAADWASAVRLRAEGASSDVPAAVGAVGATVTLVPDDPLAPGTDYTVTVDASVADAAGNALGAPVSWSFTTATPPGEVVDDTAADFAAGTTGPDTYVSVTDDGEVTLAPLDGIELEGSALPAGWTSTLWSGGPGGSTVAAGAVAVDGALLAPAALAGPGRSLEVRATFGAAELPARRLRRRPRLGRGLGHVQHRRVGRLDALREDPQRLDRGPRAPGSGPGGVAPRLPDRLDR